MKLAEEKVVLFVDMLGFASLTEHNPVDVQDLSIRERLSGLLTNSFVTRPENPLTDAFWTFHYNLKWILETARMTHPVTAISFSDSAFIATTYLHEAVRIAINFTQGLLTNGVPARAGIAHGSFAAVRFKSDVTLDSSEHAAHFLGTGVVRATAAESCGVKGMRILLHPSATSLLSDSAHNPPAPAKGRVPIVELLESERDNPRNRSAVGHEIDYWSFNKTEGKKAWHNLQDMWNAVPEEERVHYEATAKAVDRMRVGQGYKALANLRRRTLPRV